VALADWYPLDFTFVCPTELLAISDRIAEFTELDCAVLGASCDLVYSHRTWMNTPRDKNGIEGLAFPLLADKTGRIARDYGVLIEDEGYSLRGLFLIDPDGILVHMTINANTVGRSVSEVLRTLQAFQSGGLCGSDWKPGDKNL
jgi:peroxiredoxin 2/4